MGRAGGKKFLRIVSIDKLRAEGLVHVSKLPGNLVGAPGCYLG